MTSEVFAETDTISLSNHTLQRREEIMRLMAEHGKAGVEELSKRFSVSTVTIRNDLSHLNDKGLVIRSRGGAIARKTSARELALSEKHGNNQDIKEKFGRYAATLINNGNTIILDSGTTSQEVALHKDIKLMMTGGHYRQICAYFKEIIVDAA